MKRFFPANKLLILFLIIGYGCTTGIVDNNDEEESGISIYLTKWYNNHTAAISIANDVGSPESAKEQAVQEEILKRNLTMDYELVTYNLRDEMRAYIIEYLIPNGFGIFGHGHKHIDHDKLTYQEAYESFKTNYDIMVDMGIQPISYAYPEGAGHRDSTQMALANAGFLNGRLHRTWDHTRANIVPGDDEEPDNWYYLPSLVMQDYDFMQNEAAINNAAELVPFLEDALANTAWLIKTYHAIGRGPGYYGFFDWDEFMKALDEVASRDFWPVSMDNATRYIKQRNSAHISIDTNSENNSLGYDLEITHSLDNSMFNHPMTVAIGFPEELSNKIFGLYHGDALIDQILVSHEESILNLEPFKKYTLIQMD